MAVMDIAWFYPDVIDPASHVPTGIGAVAFLDRLQAHLDVATHDAAIDAIIAQQPVQWLTHAVPCYQLTSNTCRASVESITPT